MKLGYTRAIITAILDGDLDNVEYNKTDIFNLMTPASCNGVPKNLLNPKDTWADENAFNEKANHLAGLFLENFKKYSDEASADTIAASPQPLTSVVI